jgi:hypothetical protein
MEVIRFLLEKFIIKSVKMVEQKYNIGDVFSRKFENDFFIHCLNKICLFKATFLKEYVKSQVRWSVRSTFILF